MTRDQLQARLDAYLAAETKILGSQEYTVGDGGTSRRNRRADLAEVRAQIEVLRADLQRIDDAAAGRPIVYYARPFN